MCVCVLVTVIFLLFALLLFFSLSFSFFLTRNLFLTRERFEYALTCDSVERTRSKNTETMKQNEQAVKWDEHGYDETGKKENTQIKPDRKHACLHCLHQTGF